MRELTLREQTRMELESQCIKPALLRAGWREDMIRYRRRFSNGITCLTIKDEPGLTIYEEKRPAFTLYYWENLPLAVIRLAEPGETLPIALDHALHWAGADQGGLDLYCVYATDGVNCLEHDLSNGQRRHFDLGQFPSPARLWSHFLATRGLRQGQGDKLLGSYPTFDGRRPRHFEYIILNRIVEAILKGQQSMAVINGALSSTYFIIPLLIRQLWEARLARRFLYLTEKAPDEDPRILQYFQGFAPVITHLGHLPAEQEEYRPLIVSLIINESTSKSIQTRQLPPDYFDMVIVDEFHQETSAADTVWQEGLGRFRQAVQVGVTFMEQVSILFTNHHHFGAVICQYTEKQAESDGFYRPAQRGDRVPLGQAVPEAIRSMA